MDIGLGRVATAGRISFTNRTHVSPKVLSTRPATTALRAVQIEGLRQQLLTEDAKFEAKAAGRSASCRRWSTRLFPAGTGGALAA
jgi:hypothetical protein